MLKKWQRITLYSVLAGMLLTVTGVLGVACYFANALMTHPLAERQFVNKHSESLLQQQQITDYEKITLTTKDNLHLKGIYLPSQNGGALIIQHGYKMSWAEMIPITAILHRHGYGAILLNLRAHGDSEGETITFGHAELNDLDAAYHYLLTRKEVDPEKIGAIGNSMGAVLAILYAANNPKIKAVVAHGPYASLEDTVGVSVKKFAGLPAFPFAPLILKILEYRMGASQTTIAPLTYIHQISRCAVFILSAGKDTFVNPTGGKRLYEAAADPREFWFDPDLEHVEFDTKHPEEFEQRVVAFLDKYVLASSNISTPIVAPLETVP
jgi:dienelactone hydrolase